MPKTNKKKRPAARRTRQQAAREKKRADWLEGRRLLTEEVRNLQHPFGSDPKYAGCVAVFQQIQRNCVALLEYEQVELVKPP